MPLKSMSGYPDQAAEKPATDGLNTATTPSAAGTTASGGSLDGLPRPNLNQTVEENEKLKAISAALILAEERERRILAQYLHDDLGQLFAIMAIKMAEIKNHEMPKALKLAVDDCAEIIQLTNLRLRELTLQLNPPMFDQPGFETAMESMVDELQRNFQITVSIEDDGSPKTMEPAVSSSVLRALRELLIKLARHSQAHQITISMMQEKPDTLQLTVSDSATGFYQASDTVSEIRKEFGLLNMGESLGYFGSEIFMHSQYGHPTSIILSVPLLPSAAGDKEFRPRTPA